MRALLLLTVAARAAAQAPAGGQLLPGDDTVAASVIRTLAAAAKAGQRELLNLRGNPLDGEYVYAFSPQVPDTWSCRVRALQGPTVLVRCDIAPPTGQGQAEYDRLAALLHALVGKKGWRDEERAGERIVEHNAGVTERAVSYAWVMDRRKVSRINMQITTGAPDMRVPRGSDRLIVLTVWASSRAR